MKKGLKKLLGLGLAVSLALGCNGMTVLADEPSFSEAFNGATANASVRTTSNGASATTSYSKPATIEAKVTVYYIRNGSKYTDQSGTASASIGGATATVSIGSGGGDVVGAKGLHYIYSGSAVWRHETTTGTTW
ncbi:MAG: hypothetical protein K2K21_12435 [Lachnospiraceae bacterium]|nr:hypothetical protein [Lachnospiraceae bacterium]